MALATISYNDIVHTETFENKKDGRALHLMKSAFGQSVLDFINSPTPQKFILKREGTGGKMFDYIPGWYAKKCANYAFGFNYSFEIKHKEIVGVSAIVEGRFIVNDPKTGREIMHKDDVGGHIIRFLKGQPRVAENAVDVANDYKSAVTDCMKRCMAQIGFWKDVYGASEMKEADVQVKDEPTIVYDQPTNQTIKRQAPIEVKAQPVKPVEVDYIKRLEDHLTKCAGKTVKERKEYLQKVVGPMAATRYEQLKATLTQSQAQQIFAAVMKGEAEGRK